MRVGVATIVGAALAALLVGGCVPVSSSAPGERVSPQLAAALASEPGPRRWSAEAQASCLAREPERKLACYEEALLATLREHGVRAAMETLDRLAAADPDAWQQGHLLAHVVGLAAYRSADEVGELFAACTPLYQSGCYHGVIQAYFGELERAGAGTIAAPELNRLCADYRGESGDRWLLFQCAHGMGHGLVALNGYHLPRALASCDLLGDDWERESCYGGAFMENLVNATMPHHAPGEAHRGARTPPVPHAATGSAEGREPTPERGVHGHEEAGRHAHHHGEGEADHHGAHHATLDGSEYVALDPDRPHYPCSELDDRYLNACYAMQTSAVLFWSEGDVAVGVAFCEEAPEQVRSTCFISLGRDINAYTRQDHAEAIEQCSLAPEHFRPACVVGVAKNLIDVTAEPADGVAFCRVLPEGATRIRCFQAVGEQVAVLEHDPARRAERCAGLAEPDAAACRSGAGVRVPVRAGDAS